MHFNLHEFDDLTFLIGNGINRYPDDLYDKCWENLLTEIYSEVTGDSIASIPEGIHLTEFYETIVLNSKFDETAKDRDSNIRRRFKNKLDSWKINNVHYENITNKIKDLNAPIMTTNFDDLLEKASGATISWTIENRSKNFTSYYPWETYYSDDKENDPLNNFSIWHLQGQKKYERSIKLGTRQYFKMIKYADNILPANTKKKTPKKYFKTWLPLFFNKNLFIFGLGLKEQELFLRWILLERARYFNRNPQKQKKGWYIFIEELDFPVNEGKRFFLNQLGIEYLTFETKDEFYNSFWNSL